MLHNLKTGLGAPFCPQCAEQYGRDDPRARGAWRRPSPEIQALEEEHMREHHPLHPVVAAKIDELIETGNRHGVTPELIDDAVSVIGDPRA